MIFRRTVSALALFGILASSGTLFACGLFHHNETAVETQASSCHTTSNEEQSQKQENNECPLCALEGCQIQSEVLQAPTPVVEKPETETNKWQLPPLKQVNSSFELAIAVNSSLDPPWIRDINYQAQYCVYII